MSDWGLIKQGGWDDTGPILLRGVRLGTNAGGGRRDGPVGLLEDRPRGALAAEAEPPEVAGVAPLQGWLIRGASRRQGGRNPGASRGLGGHGPAVRQLGVGQRGRLGVSGRRLLVRCRGIHFHNVLGQLHSRRRRAFRGPGPGGICHRARGCGAFGALPRLGAGDLPCHSVGAGEAGYLGRPRWSP